MYDFTQSRAITDRNHYPTAYSSVEYDFFNGISEVPAVCYVRGTAGRKLKIRFAPGSPPGNSTTARVVMSYTVPDPAGGSPIVFNSTQEVPWTNPGNGVNVEVNLDWLPNYVSTGTFSAAAGMLFPGGGPGDHGTWDALGFFTTTLYQTERTPASVQATPWIEVLADACAWACTKSNATDCAVTTTRGAYHSGRFSYNTSTAASYYVFANPGTLDLFTLKQFYDDDYASTSPICVNCYDMAGFGQICLNALGETAQCQYLGLEAAAGATDTNPNFVTNHIRAIGGTNFDDGYQSVYWNNHQQVWLASQVYDSCLAIEKNLDNTLYKDNPVSWAMNDYWQKNISATETAGLVFRRLQRPAEPPLGTYPKQIFLYNTRSIRTVSYLQDPGGGSFGVPMERINVGPVKNQLPTQGVVSKLTATKQSLVKSSLIAGLPAQYSLVKESDLLPFPLSSLRFEKKESLTGLGKESIEFRFQKFDDVKSAENAVRNMIHYVQGTNGKALNDCLKYGLPEGRAMEGLSFYVADEKRGSMVLAANLGRVYAEVRFTKMPTLNGKGAVVYSEGDYRLTFGKVMDALLSSLQSAQ